MIDFLFGVIREFIKVGAIFFAFSLVLLVLFVYKHCL